MLLLKIKETGVTPRRLRGVVRDRQVKMFGRLGEYWHRFFRPKHFTQAGATEYGYQRRSPKYERRKLRLYGHSHPLVATGESRELSRMKDVRATSKGVRIIMPAIRKLNFTPQGGTIKMAEEMRTISANEQKQLEKLGEHHMNKNEAA